MRRVGLTIRLLLLMLALGALGLVACDDDDDETAPAETEVITSEFGQDDPGRGATAIAGGPNACRDWRRGPGDIIVEINALKGVIRCREAKRVLKNYYRDPGNNTRPWSCEDYGEVLVQCMKPGGTAFNGTLACRGPAPGRRPVCPGF